VFPLGLHRSVRLEVTSAARLEELQVVTTGLCGQGEDLKVTLPAQLPGDYAYALKIAAGSRLGG